MSVDPEDHEAVFQRMMAECEAHDREFKALKKRVALLETRRREGRQLLRRMVKAVRKSRDATSGFALVKLDELVIMVAEYLEQTTEPGDILR